MVICLLERCFSSSGLPRPRVLEFCAAYIRSTAWNMLACCSSSAAGAAAADEALSRRRGVGARRGPPR
eukprot:3385058-Prymnesium_polylepis.1